MPKKRIEETELPLKKFGSIYVNEEIDAGRVMLFKFSHPSKTEEPR